MDLGVPNWPSKQNGHPSLLPFSLLFFVRCLRPPSPSPCCAVDIRTCNRCWDLAGMGIMSSKKYLNGGYGDSFVDNFPQKKKNKSCMRYAGMPGKVQHGFHDHFQKVSSSKGFSFQLQLKGCVGDSIPKGSWWQIKTWKTSKWPNGHKTIQHKQVEVPNGAGL